MPVPSGKYAHPWLRIERILRAIVQERWDAEARKELRAMLASYWKERKRVRQAGWFN